MTRVLFPLDGSERSFRAMDKALDVLKGAPAQVTILVVRQEGFDHAPPEVIEKFEADMEDEIFPTEQSAVEVFRHATARVRKRGIQLRLKIVKGSVMREIVNETRNHDLMVMHSMAKWGKLARFKRTRTEPIARRSHCSVMLVSDLQCYPDGVPVPRRP